MEEDNLDEGLDTEVSEEQLDYEDTNAVSSKLASMLGGDEDNPELPETQPVKAEEAKPEPEPLVVPDDYKVKVKIDGVEQEIPLAELKNGYSRQSDYTQKTQELAQQRQELINQQQQYNQYLQSIPMLSMVAEQNIQNAYQQLYSPEMIQLAQTDPAEYVAKKAQIESIMVENQQAHSQMIQQYQDQQNQQHQLQSQALQEILDKSNEMLAKEINGWGDETVKKELYDYAVKNEFTQNEVENLYDARMVRVLNKARLYDQLITEQPLAKQKVNKVPPKSVMTPGNTEVDEAAEFQSRKKAALRSGNDRDIAAVLAEML